MVRSYIEYHKRRQLLANVIIAFVILAVLFMLVVNFVTVPYTVQETYDAEEPYEEIEFYNESVEREVLVPKTEQVEVIVDVPIRPPSAKLDPRPVVGFRREEDCHLEDYNYTLDFISNKLGNERYDVRTETGYKNGRFIALVEICNKEKKRMYIDFKICKYGGDNLVDCKDRLNTGVEANFCNKFPLRWETAFDPDKYFKLEHGAVSQKIVCRNRSLKANEESPEYVTSGINPPGTAYGRYLQDPARIKTKSGYLGTPKTQEALIRYDLATATQKDFETVTTFDRQIVEDIMQKNRTLSKTRVVQKTREIIRYRTLWQHLMQKLKAS